MTRQIKTEIKEIHTFSCDTELEVDEKIKEMEAQGWKDYKVNLIVDAEDKDETKVVKCFEIEFMVIRQRQDFV